MNREEYLDRLNLACEQAGRPDDGWNDRLVEAIKANGLKMVFENPIPRQDECDCMAPVPMGAGTRYEYPAWIIPNED